LFQINFASLKGPQTGFVPPKRFLLEAVLTPHQIPHCI